MSFVYFIVCGDFVKIGHSANPRNRLAEMQTGSPFKHELALTIEGTRADESEYHKQFSAQWHQGEWFRFDGALRSFVYERVGQPTTEQAIAHAQESGYHAGVVLALDAYWKYRLEYKHPELDTAISGYLNGLHISAFMEAIDWIADHPPEHDETRGLIEFQQDQFNEYISDCMDKAERINAKRARDLRKTRIGAVHWTEADEDE